MWPRRAGKQNREPNRYIGNGQIWIRFGFWIWIMESCLLYNYTAVPLAHTVWSWTSFLLVLWCFVSCYLARLLPERNKLTVHKRYIILSVLSFHWRPLDSKTSTMRTICGVRVRASVILAGKRDSRRGLAHATGVHKRNTVPYARFALKKRHGFNAKAREKNMQRHRLGTL